MQPLPNVTPPQPVGFWPKGLTGIFDWLSALIVLGAAVALLGLILKTVIL
jgi:hypothetical protein